MEFFCLLNFLDLSHAIHLFGGGKTLKQFQFHSESHLRAIYNNVSSGTQTIKTRSHVIVNRKEIAKLEEMLGRN